MSSGVICQLSREIIPNLLFVLHERAAHVTLIPTKGTEDVLERLSREMTFRSIAFTALNPVNAFEPAGVGEQLRTLLRTCDGHRWVVNMTNGTNAMVAAASIEGARHDADLVYLDTATTACCVFAAETGQQRHWTPPASIAIFVRLSGCEEQPAPALFSSPELARFTGRNRGVSVMIG